MKKFICFAFEDYEARGGIDDILGSFDTLPEAVAHLLDINTSQFYYENRYVVDRDTWEKVHEVERPPYRPGSPGVSPEEGSSGVFTSHLYALEI